MFKAVDAIEESLKLVETGRLFEKILEFLKNKWKDFKCRLFKKILRKIAQEKPEDYSRIVYPAKKEKTAHNEKRNNKSEVINDLISRGVQIKKQGNEVIEEEEAEKLYGIYKYMGEKYEHISHFLHKLRSSFSGKEATLNMKTFTDKEITYSCQLASKLFEIGYLDFYKYFKSPKFIMKFRVCNFQKALSFITGKWLEFYIGNLLEKELKKQNISYSLLKNPVVDLPWGRRFEMDLVLKVADEFFWLEIKSGQYKSYINKYKQIGQRLSIKPENQYLVVAEETEDIVNQLSDYHEYNILNLEMFKRNLSEMFILNNETKAA